MTIHNLTGSDFLRNSKRKTSTKLQKTLEKLSSGYQINRAADDAARLAISEKTRSILAGLDQGTKNINDGVSFLHTQDGAAQEMHNILNRLEQLAVQSANGTYSNVDRDAIDLEYQHLVDEIGYITDTADFNGIPLFEKHLEAYGMCEGVTVHDSPIEISDNNMPILVGYSVDGVQKEYKITVPYGTYDADELADLIDTDLFNNAPNLIIGLNEANQFTMQVEPGKLNYIGGPGASLFFDVNIGSSDGYLLGVTVFQSERARLQIYSGENDVMSFRLGSDDTLYSVTLDPGRYTRSELIDHINEKITAAGIPGNVHAIPETNKDGGLIIGLASSDSITGLSGNFIKMDNKSSPIYDIANYGYTNNTQSVLLGKRSIGANTEILRGRNNYFTLDLKWYGDDGSAESRRITVNLLDDGENERTYATPLDLVARINEQIGDDLPFTASISSSGTIEIKSDQYGSKCGVDLVESDTPSPYMVYDLFDSGSLRKLSPSQVTSQFTPASLTSKKTLDSSIIIPADENELSFTIQTDSGTQTLNLTIPAGTYTASSLQDVLNNGITSGYPDLAGKLKFTVGNNINLSAIKFDGADIKSITASSSASAYNRLIAGVYYTNSYTIEQGKEEAYSSSSGTMPSGQPAVTSEAGSSVNAVNYVDQTTSAYQQQQNYIIYNQVTPTIKNGYEVEIESSESFVGDEQVEKYPATMTLANVMTQFTADGVSRRDVNLSLSIADSNGNSSFNILVPKGSTKEQALSAIQSGLGSSATASLNGNSLVITTASKGNGVQIACGNCTMAYSAYKNSLASRSDAVLDIEHNRVYIPSSLTIPNVASQLPYTVDASNDRFIFKAGATNYDLSLTHKTYTSADELAAELNAKIAAADGGTAKTTVTVASSGKALVFRGPATEPGTVSINSSSSCDIYKTKVVTSTAGNPNYNPATGKIENPAKLVAAGFDSHFPMTVTSANNTITFKYTSPDSGTQDITIVIPDGTYSSPADAASAISGVIAADPALSSIISASYVSSGTDKGLVFKTVTGGAGYSLNNLGGTAKLNEYIKKATVGSGGTVDSASNKVVYPASISNAYFSSLFSGGGLEITSSNKHFALTANGTTVEFDLNEGKYSGTSGMNDILSQLQNGLAGSGLTASVSGSTLKIVTDGKGSSQNISMSGSNTSPVFSRPRSIAKESTVTRVDRRCSITGKNQITSIELNDYDNKMSFEYSVEAGGNLVSGTADITIPEGTYTADTLAAAIQTAIDAKLGPDQLDVTVSNGYISIVGSGPSDTRSISNFEGRLFDKVFQNASYNYVSVHTETAGTSMGSSVSYIIGRNTLEPENDDEIASQKNVTVYTGLNDQIVFDLHYDGDVYRVEFEIPAGDYTRSELADAIERAGRSTISNMTDHSGKNFPADFFNASIGLGELGVQENNTGITSSDKLVFWCKLPDDGRNGTVTAIIDGVRGNSAYRIFYDATRSPQPTTFLGKPDLTDGIVISSDNDTIGFDLDGVPCSIKIPHGTYGLESLADELNKNLESMGSIVRVGDRDGHLMFYTTKNGDYVFGKFTGNGADDLIYGMTGRENDTFGIGIHTGRRTDSYVMYEKARIDEHLMRINTTGITTAERALKAIDRLEGANSKLSMVRALTGANENRSLHSLSNNKNYIENLTAAESRMRDADMAKYYADYTKHQILTQAQQSVFGQMQNQSRSVLNIFA